MSNSARRARNPAEPTALQLEQAIRNKFDRLAQLQTQLANAKALYSEHDALVEELMGMFISMNPDSSFTVRRAVTVGQRTFRLNPAFYDAEKNKLTAKKWRAGASPTVQIEA